jgi:hypothetical protein
VFSHSLGRFETLRAAHWRERIEANPGDPEYRLTISAPTNADVREIDAAIVADQRRSGEQGGYQSRQCDRSRRRRWRLALQHSFGISLTWCG